jgi:uncharacterized protein (TIGR03086 family)
VISVLSKLDPRALDRAAVAVSLAVVAEVSPDQLDLPTPCGDWRLGELIAHLVAENRGFAANAISPHGEVGREVWQPGTADASALTDYPGSVEAVTAAFAPDGVLDAPVEVREFGIHPGRIAVAMHFIDYLTHSWDVARSVGFPDPIPEELAEAALDLAVLMPAERPARSPFAPVVPVAADASAGDRWLGLAGRDPHWSAR